MTNRYCFLALALPLIVNYAAGYTTPNKSPYNLSLENFNITVATQPPVVTTGGPSNIHANSVTFNGSANPSGSLTDAWFQWGLTSSFGNNTPSQSVGSGTGFVPYSDSVTGLTPNTTYHYRAIAQNSTATSMGSERTVTTLAIPPTATTLGAHSVGQSSATIQGSANPNNSATTVYFEWGLDTTYGNTTPTQSVGSGMSDSVYSATLTSLTASTAYHFRAIAQNSAGTTKGSDQVFLTNTSINEYVSDAHTIVLYHFNEPNGTFVRDYSGNNLNGTASSQNIGEGKFGLARHYNLSSDIVVAGNTPLLNTGTGGLTVEAWVDPLLGSGGNLFVAGRGNPDSANFSYALIVLASKQLEFILNDSTGGRYIVRSVDSPMTDGVWHHIAAVVKCESSSVKLYHNGSPVPTLPTGTFQHCVVPNGTFTVGLPYSGPSIEPKSAARQPEESELFHCGIDEVRISNIARQPSEFDVGAVIRGSKFHDLNSNGVRNGGEPGLSNWTIVLSGTAAKTTHTDANGNYIFMNLIPGSYTVSESAKSGWVQTLPPSNGSYSVTVTVGQDTGGLDFGNYAPSISVNKGWNMLSLPYNVSDSSVSTLFPSATSSAFGYGPLGYFTVTSLQHRLGYWLKFANNEIIPIFGSPRLSDTLVGQPDSWSLVGSISNSVPVSHITTDPPGMPVPTFFGYNGTYFVADTIKPGKAYWGKSFTRLILSGSSASPHAMHNRLIDLSSLNALTITDAHNLSQTLYFGAMKPCEACDNSQYELPPVPPADAFDVRFASQRFVEPIHANVSMNLKILTQALVEPVTLAWKINDDHAQYMLRDEYGFSRELTTTGSVTVKALFSTLVLHIEAKHASTLPKEFALEQNYPNPFNPTTVIRYQIPVPCKVMLKVYNVLGQEILTLIEGIQEAGHHALEFDANRLPSGVYFYKLTAESLLPGSGNRFTDVKHMLLTK